LRRLHRDGTLQAIMTNHATVTSAAPSLDDRLLRLFADPLRAQLVSLLASEQLCTCHLADATGALPSAVSNHLRQLKEARIVESEPCGRYTYYRLRPEALDVLAVQFSALAQSAVVAPKRPC
jgi:ArsR family transcriptional regulator